MSPTAAPAIPHGVAAADRSARHLTDDQVGFFDEHGYLVLRNRIPAALLTRLQTATAAMIHRGRTLGTGVEDHLYATRGDRDVMWRVDYVHDKGEQATLELLGSPEVLGIAESLVGPDLVPTYESLVFKDTGDGAPVFWHQDAIHPRRHRIVNVDVYLDDSRSGAGALWVVPGSQRGPIDACGISSDHGWDVPGAVEVEMAAGDVLLHDVMVVHGSPPTVGNALRRTLYYEFRSVRQIRDEGPWDDSWVTSRRAMLAPALRAYAAAFPDGEHVTLPGIEVVADIDEIALRVPHPTHTPGSFCSAGDVPAALHHVG